MTMTMKCFAAVLAIGAMTGCEALREQAQVRGADVLSADGGSRPDGGGDCEGCRRKWTAKPDGGVNSPPWTGGP